MKTSSYIRQQRIKNHQLRYAPRVRWPEIVQLIISHLSLVGVIFLVVQIDQVERAIKGETYSKIYEQEFMLFQNLLNDTTYYSYLYEKKETIPGTIEHKKVTVLIALFADYFEHICLQTENLDKEVKVAWEQWMFSMYESTPMLKEHFEDNLENYSPKCQNMINDFKKRISGVPSQ